MADAVGTITWAELGSPKQPGIYSGGGYNKVNVTAVNIAAAENNPAALCTIVEIAGEESPAQYAISLVGPSSSPKSPEMLSGVLRERFGIVRWAASVAIVVDIGLLQAG